MRKTLLLCIGLISFGVAGCAEQKLPLADVAVIRAADGSSDGMDIYAARRQAGETVPNLRGNQIVEIRTYLPRINDFGQEVPGQEIAGVECEAILDTHGAKVRTPGGIHVPLYGYVTAPFSVTCEKEGFTRAVAVFEPFNKTFADRRAATSAAGAGAGLIGVLVVAVAVEGINAASDERNDEFTYAASPILMRQGSASAGSQEAAVAQGGATPLESPQQTVQPAPSARAVVVPAEKKRPRLEQDHSCSPWCRN